MEQTSPEGTRPGQPQRGQAPRRRLSGGVSAGRILGIPVTLSLSLLILAVFVAFTSGQAVARERADLPPLATYGLGLAFVCGLVFSVLLHELGHALTARRFGIGVRGITLELIGGYTELDREAPRPRVEFVVAVVGPLVSLVIGLLMTGVFLVTPAGGIAHGLAFQLALGNVIVAVYNALPGLPLDGGRALAAVVWRMTGDRHRGTEAAGWGGRAIAVVTMAGGLLLYRLGWYSSFGMVLALLIGMTIWSGATVAVRMGQVGRRVPMLRVDRLTRPLYPVTTGTPLSEALRQAAEAAPPGTEIGVRDGTGRVTAVVHPDAAASVPERRRPWLAVDAVARAVPGSLPLHLSGEDVIRAVQASPADQYLVTSGDDVVGVLRTADLARLLDARGNSR